MRLTLILLFITLNAFAQPKPVQYVMSAPAGSEYTKIDRAGKTVLPNGRYITPRGRQIQTAPHPYGLILSPDGNTVITANSGINPFSISIVRDIFGSNPTVKQIPEGNKTDNGVLEACFMGLAISPDNNVVHVAGGETNKIFTFDITTGKATGSIDCRVKTATNNYRHGYIGDMALTRDGKTLYALDQIGFRMLVIDVATKTIRHNIPTGRYPFGITLSPDEKMAYVANVGVFEYKPFTDLDRKDLKKTAHDYPSSKYGSKEMRDGDEQKGVPALGDPNAPEAFSVWGINLSGTPQSGRSRSGVPAGAAPAVTAKIKTGFLVGAMVEDFPAVGGSSPNSVVATDQYVFVSNGNNDCVSVIDVKTNAVVKNITLSPDSRLGNLRGVIPFGLALSPDFKKLYVAEAGINAVAVVDVPTLSVLGHIPTGWFPSKLKVSLDGKHLIVANAKGYGSGPNGGKNFDVSKKGSFIGSLMNGTVSVIAIPTDTHLKAETEQVIANNFTIRSVADVKPTTNPIPAFAGQKQSPIKHIVFIAKENRTYDEVFGQVKNGDGDSTLARYGTGVLVKSRRGNQTVEKANVMPNHLALARQFAMSDNFYCDSDVSADGHRWLVNTYPNEWVETGTAAAYGGKRNLRDSSAAPGNLAFYGSAGSIYPEDYNEGGSMWEHLERWKKDFFNFGFGVEMAASYSDSTMKYVGEKYTINYPLPAPLFDRSSRTFPTYNMAVPDQFRADVFMKEFNEKWIAPGPPTPKGGVLPTGVTPPLGVGGLPAVITLMLPNDHGTSPRPKAGFPFTESYMADNDLALGRTIEFLSKTPYWKEMAIFVVEDDPQGGVDHIDAHRSLMLAISPYIKRSYVGKMHYSFGSVFKTFWNILGIPCLNQYDAGATDLSDLFTDKPDFTPYRAVPADVRLFDPQKALDPFDEKFDWKAFSESEELDRTETMQKRRAEDDEEAREKAKKKRKKEN